MTAVEVKGIFEEYRTIVEEIADIISIVDEQRDLKAVTLTGMPMVRGGTSSTERAVLRLEEICRCYADKLNKLYDKLDYIEGLMELVDGWERSVLRKKYIAGWTWEEFGIAYEEGAFRYSRRQAERVHCRAIGKIARILGERAAI